MSYKRLTGKLRVFLTGKTVAIVTSDVMKMIFVTKLSAVYASLTALKVLVCSQ